MKKRRRSRVPNPPYPPHIWSGMAKTAMQANRMFLSSGEVIFIRSKMLSEAFSGGISWAEPEFSRMWQEKIAAYMESYNAYNQNILKSYFLPGADMAENINAFLNMQVSAVNASIKPYYKKSVANAKRLRGKTRR